MTVMLDINVLLDVIQKRQPHFPASAALLELIAKGTIKGCVPAHAVTTVHYIVTKYADRAKADRAVDWLLARTSVVPAGRDEFRRARSLPLSDFEDAVVVAVAEVSCCEYVISRNVSDFTGSPVPALTPEELLVQLADRQ